MKKYKLTEICKFIRNGVTIKQNNLSKSGYPITRIETISKGTIDNTKMGYADIFDNEKYRDWFLKKGDILISHINSESHLGKSAIYDGEDDKIIHGMNLLGVRVWKEKVDPNYLRFYFLTKNYKSQIKKIMKKSVNQASFSVNDFKEISISLPEIEIQEKIVKRLETLNFIINKRNQQLSQLELLKKSLFRSMFGDLETNEKNWQKVKVEEIAKVFSSKRIYESEYVEKGIPFLRSKEIVELSEKKELSSIIFISQERFKKLEEKYEVPIKDDILITAVGTIGKIWVVNTSKKFYYKDGNIIQLRKIKNFSTIFLKELLDKIFEKIKTKISTGTAYSALTIKDLKKVEIYFPPIELQNKFAERIEQIDKCLFEVKNSIKELETLYNSLMDKYFN